MHMSANFFYNATATTEPISLSLHDALPISGLVAAAGPTAAAQPAPAAAPLEADPSSALPVDRKSTRLNSSHANISYAVFCLKKKKCLTIERRCAAVLWVLCTR